MKTGKGCPATGAVSRLAFLVLLALAGCAKTEPAEQANSTPPPTAPANTPTPPTSTPPRFALPFDEATVADQPDQYLPDVTLTNKSVGKLYEEVRKRWEEVPIKAPDGHLLAYSATLETALGPIDIELRPDLAPNHVRNFIALARAGYYDGLVFERVIHQQAEDNPDVKLEVIEGGCPIGTGDKGYGSIGYWLKPEFSPEVKHEEGTIGACRWEEPDSAACRFYICLTKAPVLDGERTIFGKVRGSLDVVRRIATQPIANSPVYPSADRPSEPIVIRKVVVTVQSAEKPAKGG